MKNFSLFDRIIHNLNLKLNPYLGKFRRNKLNNINFTIISNNCWGGICYEYFNLRKNSPTVGVYFFPDDYLKFVKNLRYYLSKEIQMIKADESKYFDELKTRGELEIPIGKIDDIEIIFLHYKDPDIAKDKWERRRKNVNWDNIILKFSYMNGCNDDHVHDFEKIKGIKKFALVSHEFPEYNDCKIASYAIKDGQIINDTFFFNKDIDIIELINSKVTGYYLK